MSLYLPGLLGARTYRRSDFPGTLAPVLPPAQRLFQRTTRTGGASNLGQAAVPIALLPTAAVTTLEVQLRDAATPTTILAPWTRINTALLAANAAVTVTFPVPARLGWTLIDLRANGEFDSIVTTPPIGVGEVVAATGQSLASDFWSTTESGDTTTLANLGLVPNPYTSCLAAWDGAIAPTATTGWATPADGSTYPSAFATEFLNRLVAGLGVNCALVGYAYTGQPIGQWRRRTIPATPICGRP